MSTIIVGGVIEKNGKYLLVQEAKLKCRGKWNIPAGHLEEKENIFEGAKREIFEETGCKVELTGIVQIVNKVLEDNSWISIIFSTKIIKENIKINKSEILDIKWYSYEEIINMKTKLRDYDYMISTITAAKDNKVADIDIIKITN